MDGSRSSTDKLVSSVFYISTLYIDENEIEYVLGMAWGSIKFGGSTIWYTFTLNDINK